MAQENEAQNQRKPRFKTMAQKIKKKPSYNRKSKHSEYVQFRCSLNAFSSVIADVKPKLNQRQKMLLKKTPFWNFIELFYHKKVDMSNLNKSDLDLIRLLNQFDPDSKSFKFGTKSFHITGNEVTEILGLPNKGESVTLAYDRYTAAFRTRHFGQKGKPSKSQVEAALQKTIALAEQKEQKKQKKRGKAKKEAEEKEGEDSLFDLPKNSFLSSTILEHESSPFSHDINSLFAQTQSLRNINHGCFF